VKVGLFLSAQFPPETPAEVGLEAILEQARLADELGFESIWLGHHYLARSAFLQPLSLAAHLAAVTTRVRIGFGVLVAPLYNPIGLAEELATLDVLSGGRIVAGLGAGYRKIECTAFDVGWDERGRRLRQYVTILRNLWRGESVTASGTWGAVEDARLELSCVQEGGPPIWLGALAPAGIRRAADLDAPWIIGPEGDDAAIAERLAVYRALLEERGHDLVRDYPLTREGAVAATTEDAVAAIRPHLAAQYAAYRSWDAAQAIDVDEFVREQCLVGEPAAIVDRLLRLEQELGITHVNLRMQFSGMPHEQALAGIRMFGEQVVPHVGHPSVPTGR
jgi:alkanesulfonate monooxygenase SsuD/methylene tetrahydromethanopterin reductase-like flavin-dependent oxidoreductase (luciferase family)